MTFERAESEGRERLRAMSSMPRIRPDLRFTSGNASWVVVTDPRARQRGKLNTFEYHLVQQMNGENTVHQLLQLARTRAPRVTSEQLEQFIDRLMQQGWLADDASPDAAARTVIDPEFMA